MGSFAQGIRPFNPQYAQMALDAMRRGMTLLEHCRIERKADPDYPEPATLRDWEISPSPAAVEWGFRSKYILARVAQAEYWADEIQAISDDGKNDFMDRRRLSGEIQTKVDHECVQRSRLRVDTRRWLLSKLHPTVYAERIQHQTLGADGQAVDPPSAISPIDLSAMLKGWRPKE